MTFDPQDPKWTAYVVDELDATAKADIERELADSPAARQLVEELRNTIGALTAELQAEPAAKLADSQRAAILTAAADNRVQLPPQPGPRRRLWVGLALAASLLLAIGLILPAMQTAREAAPRSVASNHLKQAGLAEKVDDGSDVAAELRNETAATGSASDDGAQKRPWYGVTGGELPAGVGARLEQRASKAVETKSKDIAYTVVKPVHGTGKGKEIDYKVAKPVYQTKGPQDQFNGPVTWADRSAEYQLNRNYHEPARSPAETQSLKAMVTPRVIIQEETQDRLGVAGLPRAVTEWQVAPNSAESYEPISDNPFLPVMDNPLSTFSIDVDTASYANMRRYLQQNHQLPPASAVRIEELVNYFSYDYPQPEGDVPFSVNAEVAACPWQGEHRLLRIGLKGREMAKDRRPPSNLVFLLDVSGSMDQPNKLPLVKQAMRLLVDQLGENDRVAIVVYAGNSGLVLPSTNGLRKQDILQSLDALQAGGSTNGAGGIQQAYEVALANFIKGGTNRVILATDGDFNVGVTDRGELIKLITEKAASGVFLTALGFGMGNLKDGTLEQLADKGNGNYAYIDDVREAKKVFVEQMAGTLVAIAKDVKLQLEFNPKQVAAYRLIGYENRLLRNEDFNDDKKDAGEIGAGHTVTALYELVPATEKGAAEVKAAAPGVDPLKYQRPSELTEAAGSGDLLSVKLRYKQPDADKSQLLEHSVKDGGKSYAQASGDFKFAASVALFGMLLRDSPHKGTATFDAAIELAQEGRGSDAQGYRAEFIELVRLAKGLKVSNSAAAAPAASE